MKNHIALIVALAGLVVAGCSTLGSRIQKNQEAFDSWPTQVREQVGQGKIDVGFTQQQVRVALGKPYRVFQRTSKEGESVVWVYQKGRGMNFSVGVGVGSYGSGVGGAVSTGTNSRESGIRVRFKRGKVESIEQQGGR